MSGPARESSWNRWGALARLLGLLVAALPVHQALAQAAVVSCPSGTNSVTFNPGLTNEPQDVLITGETTYSLCATVLGPRVTTATWSVGPVLFPGNSCDNFLSTYRSTLTLQWDTGETSTVLFTTVKVALQSTTFAFVQTGTVTSGKFAGNRAVQTITYLNEDLENGCNSPSGLTRLDGPATLTIAPLL
ncbi:hypothetical protein VZQ01_27045 [Myxococcus faecalis]|uniref:hypothetical protein n=1 Tax=Myxococcus faecalis TaxID=3115646 RepID=UPI003CEC51E1